MVLHNIGCLIVTDPAWPSRMIGIISERDILRALARNRGGLQVIEVADVMTHHVITGNPEGDRRRSDAIDDQTPRTASAVTDDGELQGLVLDRDLVKNQVEELFARKLLFEIVSAG